MNVDMCFCMNETSSVFVSTYANKTFLYNNMNCVYKPVILEGQHTYYLSSTSCNEEKMCGGYANYILEHLVEQKEHEESNCAILNYNFLNLALITILTIFIVKKI